MDAALTLVAERRGFRTFGLRELARRAGVNANTIYRHFASMEDLGIEVVWLVKTRVQTILAQLGQLEPRTHDHVDEAQIQASNELYFEFVATESEAMLFTMAELHGPSGAICEALNDMLLESARHVAANFARSYPHWAHSPMLELFCRDFVNTCLHYSEIFIKYPHRAEEIKKMSALHIIWLQLGFDSCVRREQGLDLKEGDSES